MVAKTLFILFLLHVCFVLGASRACTLSGALRPRSLWLVTQHHDTILLQWLDPLWRDPETIDVTSRWRDDWQSVTEVNSSLMEDCTIWLPGFDLHLFTSISGHCWIVLERVRATVIHGASPTTNYVTVVKPKQCRISSTLVHWPSCDYCAHMKQMRRPSNGWQHMAPSIWQQQLPLVPLLLLLLLIIMTSIHLVTMSWCGRWPQRIAVLTYNIVLNYSTQTLNK